MPSTTLRPNTFKMISSTRAHIVRARSKPRMSISVLVTKKSTKWPKSGATISSKCVYKTLQITTLNVKSTFPVVSASPDPNGNAWYAMLCTEVVRMLQHTLRANICKTTLHIAASTVPARSKLKTPSGFILVPYIKKSTKWPKFGAHHPEELRNDVKNHCRLPRPTSGVHFPRYRKVRIPMEMPDLQCHLHHSFKRNHAYRSQTLARWSRLFV